VDYPRLGALQRKVYLSHRFGGRSVCIWYRFCWQVPETVQGNALRGTECTLVRASSGPCPSSYKATRIQSRGSILMTLSNSNHLQKPPPLNAIFRFNFKPFNTLQWRLNLHTRTRGGVTQTMSWQSRPNVLLRWRPKLHSTDRPTQPAIRVASQRQRRVAGESDFGEPSHTRSSNIHTQRGENRDHKLKILIFCCPLFFKSCPRTEVIWWSF
jgi:hypothetical protein